MEKEFIPTCQERGLQKEITDDVTPGVCQINQKRQDSEWGEWWSPVVILSSEIERLVSPLSQLKFSPNRNFIESFCVSYKFTNVMLITRT